MHKEKLDAIRAKLKKKWYKKSDAVTIEELYWRDGLVRKSGLYKLAKIGISANLISFIGIGLLIKFILNLSLGMPPQNQIILIVGILASDALDGPFARLNNNVTALGTILDHTRDWIFAFVLGIATFYSILPLEWSNILLFFLAFSSTLTIFLLVIIKFFREVRSIDFFQDQAAFWDKAKEIFSIFSDYAINHLQTNLRGRIHFGGLAGAFLFFIASKNELLNRLLGPENLINLGYAVLGGAIIMAIYNLLEDHIFNGNE